jgi:transposase-like protein
MLIYLHKNARTTPAVRAEIAASKEPASVLAQRYGITVQTVYKWRKRESFDDRPHVAHRLQTVLTPAQEAVVVHLRRTLMLPLDDLLAVTREFLCSDVSRSGLDRCLRRHGVGSLSALRAAAPIAPHADFLSGVPGCLRMTVRGLPSLQDPVGPAFLFIAIDPATRWVFVALKAERHPEDASAFLSALQLAYPVRIRKLLTGRGPCFADAADIREDAPQGETSHAFGSLCRQMGIEQWLACGSPAPAAAQARAAGCFEGRMADVFKTSRFREGEALGQTLQRYVALYNHQLPQLALKSQTPAQAVGAWQVSHPHLFLRPYDPAGPACLDA